MCSSIYIFMVLICVPLITNDVKHIFLFATDISSVAKFLFMSFFNGFSFS